MQHDSIDSIAKSSMELSAILSYCMKQPPVYKYFYYERFRARVFGTYGFGCNSEFTIIIYMYM